MENQMTTSSEGKTPEQIEAEMMATRESLTEKVAALENQVVDTVQTAANTLTDTVDAVKSFVTTAPEAVGETIEQVASAMKDRVKRTFDVSSQVEENPVACMGISIGLGFITGYLLSGDGRSKVSGHRMAAEAAPPLHPHPFSSSATEAGSGFLDGLAEIVGRKLKGLAETAVEAATASLDKTVRGAIPRLIDEASNWVATEAHHTTNGFHREAAESRYEG